jgi:surface protein
VRRLIHPALLLCIIAGGLALGGCAEQSSDKPDGGEGWDSAADGPDGDSDGDGDGSDDTDIIDEDGDGVPAEDDCDDSDDTAVSRSADPECDGFYLHDNGVTVLCPAMYVGDTGQVGGTTFYKADLNYLSLLPTDSAEWTTVCTSGITDMSSLFRGAESFNQDIGGWDTSNVTSMYDMFGNAAAFNQDLGAWDVSSVETMERMFREAETFNRNVRDWDTRSVTNMDRMFHDASFFNQDLSGWCVDLIPRKPAFFDEHADAWTEPRPQWGTCGD